MKNILNLSLLMIISLASVTAQIVVAPADTITTNQQWASSIMEIDMDNDGDMDIMVSSSSDDKIAWYENLDGLGTFGSQQIITQAIWSPFHISVADINGDGDKDLLSGNAWFENLNGLGSFGTANIIATGMYYSSIEGGDIDGDGDNDILFCYEPSSIYWFENIDGLGTFGSGNAIALHVGSGDPAKASLKDVDLDGDLDIIGAWASTPNGQIVWFENTDGLGDFSITHNIANLTYWGHDIVTKDIDGDGDFDICTRDGLNLVWYENINGTGSFGGAHVIASYNNVSMESICVADMDRDGDNDIIKTITDTPDRLVWYENYDGLGSFSTEKVIHYFSNLADEKICLSDSDGDGDMDIIGSNQNLKWYEHQYRDPICIVALDIALNKNVVVWRQTHGKGIESYKVYKEVAAGVYNVIGTVPDDSLSWFVDSLSNPASHNDRYKISAIDSLGHETELSSYHKTIHLGISQGVPVTTMVLNWDDYVDESGDYFPAKYYVYRGSSLNNLQLYDSLPATQTAYNDLNVTGTYAYLIAVKKEYCKPNTSVKQSSNDVFYYSNYVTNGVIGIDELEEFPLINGIYPNPNNGSFKFITSEPDIHYSIHNSIGQILMSGIITETTMDINLTGASSGIYFIQMISTSGKTQTEKVIIN